MGHDGRGLPSIPSSENLLSSWTFSSISQVGDTRPLTVNGQASRAERLQPEELTNRDKRQRQKPTNTVTLQMMCRFT